VDENISMMMTAVVVVVLEEKQRDKKSKMRLKPVFKNGCKMRKIEMLHIMTKGNLPSQIR
jgi:hypothetical protein